jgi:hypothetical protein
MSASNSNDEDDDASSHAKGRAPRPDEMSRETFEFVAAIDQRKRDQGVPHLTAAEVLEVLAGLGYERGGRKRRPKPVNEYERALKKYRDEHGRLFPNWSEVFGVLLSIGYARKRKGDEAA